jgi:hypothetical protein
MPTKERKQKEQEKRDEEARLNKIFAELPDYLRNASSVNFPKGILEIPPECNLKGGLVSSDENGNLIPEFEVMARGARNNRDPRGIIGAANEKRRIEKELAIEDLKRRYSHLWGTSKGVSIIALREGKTARTIRRYFLEYPIVGQARKVP